MYFDWLTTSGWIYLHASWFSFGGSKHLNRYLSYILFDVFYKMFRCFVTFFLMIKYNFLLIYLQKKLIKDPTTVLLTTRFFTWLRVSPSVLSESMAGTRSSRRKISLADASAFAASGANELAFPTAMPPKMMAEKALGTW